MKHSGSKLFLSLVILITSVLPMIKPLDAEASPQTPNTRNRTIGHIAADKSVKGSGNNYIDGFGLSVAEPMYLTIADVVYSGSTSGEGKVINYSRSTKNADNGYPTVDHQEAMQWAALLNGNPNYMTSSNGLRGAWISGGGPRAEDYTGYLLSQVAEMSGGKGGDFYFRRAESSEQGSYVGVTNFLTTHRPVGSISTNKKQYEIGESVEITSSGTDFSIYNRGMNVINFYIYNVDTGKTEYAFNNAKGEYKISGTGDGKGQRIEFPLQSWVPTKPGNYEARILLTDTHARNTQNAPSVSGQGEPYKAPFTVGEPPPPPPDDDDSNDPPPPGPACSPNASRTTMDFQVVGDKDIKDYSRVASGGSAIPVEPYADITLFASKPGTFKMDGAEMQPGSKNDRTRGLGFFGSSGTVTVTYLSDDGKDCWEKSFRVQSRGGGENSCPRITVNYDSYRSGSTIEVMPGEQLRFRAEFTNKSGETDRASVWWYITKPDGTEETSGYYDTDNRDRERWRAAPHWELDLPRWRGGKPTSKPDSHDIPLERGKSYHVRIGFEGTTFANLDCNNWEVTVVVKDIACTIDEQNRIKMYRYGIPPNPYPPRGETIGTAHKIFTSMFTRLEDGRYDTNMGFYADVSGTWYLNENGVRTQLSDKLAPMEKFHLYLPEYFGSGDSVLLEFVSDTGCIRTVSFDIYSDNKCPIKTLSNVRLNAGHNYVLETYWEYEVRFGETIYLDPMEIRKGGTSRVLLDTDFKTSSVVMRWYNPDTQDWMRERDGKAMAPTRRDAYWSFIYFPSDPDTDIPLPGLYRITIYADDDRVAESCEGNFYIEIGDAGDMENLLIVKNSFTITPKAPQFPGTEATVTFDIKNAGKTEHDTTLAVRWESSPTATMLDVKGFKPGEVRTITIPTLYPQKSEDFIGNINPDKDKPDNERIWTDNRAVWPVEVMKEIPSPPGGGGDFDGGEIGLEIYDSDNRQLQRLEAQADGVWEREPARIRVVIDQTKINEGFARTEQEINANIAMYKAQLEEYESGNGVQNIRVTATPEQIVNAKSLAVYEPATLQLQVSGPGTPQQWPVSSTSTGGDFLYTGTVVPTQTTWRQVLDARPYVAQINGFVITMDYRIDFSVSYDVCSGDEEEEACDSRSFTRTMSGRYTITVTGGQRSFEVFEPNATGSIHHTAEWIEYHARDRYPDSRPNDFYAGERILSQLELQPRHRHPVSGNYPVVESAVAWISETGRQQTALQSRLVLQPAGETRWRGPNYQASKLGTREQGVDTPLMGDKQRGFEKDASYAVYYSVRFRFGVEKGFPYANKLSGTGHGQEDYRIPFRIIANAWERQGIRNHSTQ